MKMGRYKHRRATIRSTTEMHGPAWAGHGNLRCNFTVMTTCKYKGGIDYILKGLKCQRRSQVFSPPRTGRRKALGTRLIEMSLNSDKNKYFCFLSLFSQSHQNRGGINGCPQGDPREGKITQMSLCVGNRAWENKLVLQDAGVVLESERSIFMRMRRVGWICPLWFWIQLHFAL